MTRKAKDPSIDVNYKRPFYKGKRTRKYENWLHHTELGQIQLKLINRYSEGWERFKEYVL
jgi:hypothetical protein